MNKKQKEYIERRFLAIEILLNQFYGGIEGLTSSSKILSKPIANIEKEIARIKLALSS